ncbi:MAG: oligosaccharide flippase family protein, partial [Candidatus Enterosoma sp.]|nr:oligosaccharide flippase family protein [Candidatus Enterosoma sp.]
YLYAIGDKKQIKEKTKKSLKFYLLLALPAFFGLLIINPYFTTGFFGDKYQESVNLVCFLSAKILFAPLTALLVQSIIFLLVK